MCFAQGGRHVVTPCASAHTNALPPNSPPTFTCFPHPAPLFLTATCPHAYTQQPGCLPGGSRLRPCRGTPALLLLAAAVLAAGAARLATASRVAVWDWPTGDTEPIVPDELFSAATVAVTGASGAYMALLASGRVVTWGPLYENKPNWQPIDVSQSATTPTEALSNVKAIAGSFYDPLQEGVGLLLFLALLDSGRVVAWGPNDVAPPIVPAVLHSGVRAIFPSYNRFQTAQLGNGTLVSWDPATGGVVFHDDFVASLGPGVSVTTVGRQMGSDDLILLSNGTALLGFRAHKSNPASTLSSPGPLQHDVVAVSGCGPFACGLLSNGTVVGWNDFSSTAWTPAVAMQSGVVAIAGSFNRLIALKSDGSVATAHPGYEDLPQPTPSLAMSNVVGIYAGKDGFVAINAGPVANPRPPPRGRLPPPLKRKSRPPPPKHRKNRPPPKHRGY